MLLIRLSAFRKLCQSELLNWLPGRSGSSPPLQLAPPDRHQQRIDGRSLHIRGFIDQPITARKQIQHHRQVQPALIGADVGDVGDPDLVRLADLELPLRRLGEATVGLPP